MNITIREKFMLFQSLEFDVYRYLLVNTSGREDGEEKADRHLAITEKVISFIICDKYTDKKYFDYRLPVHDYLAEILTDRMDEVIGFPIYDKYPDYDVLVKKFINVIIEHLDKIEKLMKGN